MIFTDPGGLAEVEILQLLISSDAAEAEPPITLSLPAPIIPIYSSVTTAESEMERRRPYAPLLAQ